MDNTYMDIALTLAQASKCVSLSVGCVVVNSRRHIIATGVNGSLPGWDNCNNVFDTRCKEHSEWSQQYEIHAEMNALFELVSHSNNSSPVTIYVTHSPCWNCLKHILAYNIRGIIQVKEIIYNEKYHRLTEEELVKQTEFCKFYGVELRGINNEQRGSN